MYARFAGRDGIARNSGACSSKAAYRRRMPLLHACCGKYAPQRTQARSLSSTRSACPSRRPSCINERVTCAQCPDSDDVVASALPLSSIRSADGAETESRRFDQRLENAGADVAASGRRSPARGSASGVRRPLCQPSDRIIGPSAAAIRPRLPPADPLSRASSSRDPPTMATP